MTTADAIKQLQTEHDLIANERDLDGSQFAPALLEALAMAIEVMQGDGDTISRKMAIDGLRKLRPRMIDTYEKDGDTFLKVRACDVNDMLEGLPSAQPEVIRCKDCKHRNEYGHWIGCPILNTDDDNYCSYAERRTE